MRFLLPAALAAGAFTLAACGSGATAPNGSLLPAADHSPNAQAYAISRAQSLPPEHEPGFDIVGPGWEIAPSGLSEGEAFTIEIPVPSDLPNGMTPDQLGIAAYQPAALDGAPFWTLAGEVAYDAARSTLSIQSRGPGLFAAAVPTDYWTVARSSAGSYEIRYVAEADAPEGATATLVALLQVELEAARAWLIESGYPDPVDELGGPQRVYLRPLVGGPGLIQPSNVGTVILLSNRLEPAPEAIAAAVTHELFHLSQRRAQLDTGTATTWIREATAEYVTIQRLGLGAARPHIDTSCGNYQRGITDSRGINEYHNWTFVAFMETRAPGFVRQLLERQRGGNPIDALRELAGAPLSELFAQYASSYRLLQSYPLAAELSCPEAAAFAVDAGAQEYVLPPLAGLVLPIEAPDGRQLAIALETEGEPEVILWQRSGDGYEPSALPQGNDTGGAVFLLDCGEAAALVFGSGEESATVRVSVQASHEC